jgi:flagellar motor component MotA
MNETTARTMEPHLQLLGGLFLVLEQIRKEGFMSIEGDAVNPAESKLFYAFGAHDRAYEPVYLFASDVLRLMVSGNLVSSEMSRYMDAYRITTNLAAEQISMFEVVRLSLIAALDGYAPPISVEFGRQGMPAAVKPSFKALEEFLVAIRNRPKEDLQTRLDKFFDSIGAPQAG